LESRWSDASRTWRIPSRIETLLGPSSFSIFVVSAQIGHDVLFSTKIGSLPRISPAIWQYSCVVTASDPPTLTISAPTFAILDIGSVDHGMNQIAFGIGQDLPLTAFDLLARVIAPRAATFRGFHALAVDQSRAGRSLATDSFPPSQRQGMVEREPQGVVALQKEPAPPSREGGKQGGSIRHGNPPRS
jgi:hypothetical protein